MLGYLFVLAAQTAYADSPAAADTMHFIGRYDFTWSGIALAAAEFSIDKEQENYKLRIEISSKGIVNLFTRHRSDTSASGKRINGHYYPHIYESRYWTKNKPRHLKLVFDSVGRITEETVEPPEDRSERPEVPHALKDKTLDPLTLVLVVPEGNTTPRVFDAKRLWEGKAIAGDATVLRTYDGKRAAIPYLLTRKPLSGLTQKEKKEYEHGEPPLTFYFSADERHIPLYMTMPVYMGSLTGTLTKECKTWDECTIH